MLDLNSEGCTPGIHEVTLDQLRPFVCTNNHRDEMWQGLVKFLSLPVFLSRFSYAYLGGGFLSTKPTPKDIDVILQTKHPYGPESFLSVEVFFVVGLDNIRRAYSVDLHFWMENAPHCFSDYRSFFQYNRICEGNSDVSLLRKGIVKIALNGDHSSSVRIANDTS